MVPLLEGFSEIKIHFFYKQLGSGLSPQIYLYFQGFRGSKLLNGCFGCKDSKLIFMISDFKIFPIMLLRRLNFRVLLA